jgi:hypothetical protein
LENYLDDSSPIWMAWPLLAGLRRLCVERAAVTRSSYLTSTELTQIDQILAALVALGYDSEFDTSDEWYSSLRACLLG